MINIFSDTVKDPCVKAVVFGPTGVGKTTQCTTLDKKTTMMIDLEAGTLALGPWAKGAAIVNIREVAGKVGATMWEITRAISCWIGGPDPSDKTGAYSKSAFDQYCSIFGDPAQTADFKTLFFDSITVASRECFKWAQTQPDAFSEKTGKPDSRGAYGLLGREMIRWITHVQHIQKDIILAGILNRTLDDFKRPIFEPQIEGSKTGMELPGIFDEVLTLSTFKTDDGQDYRAFCCHQMNPFGYPAKDRSGTLDLLEPPDLGALIAKIKVGKRVDKIVKEKAENKTTQDS